MAAFKSSRLVTNGHQSPSPELGYFATGCRPSYGSLLFRDHGFNDGRWPSAHRPRYDPETGGYYVRDPSEYRFNCHRSRAGHMMSSALLDEFYYGKRPFIRPAASRSDRLTSTRSGLGCHYCNQSAAARGRGKTADKMENWIRRYLPPKRTEEGATNDGNNNNTVDDAGNVNSRKYNIEESWNALWESVSPRLGNGTKTANTNRKAASAAGSRTGNTSKNAGSSSSANLTELKTFTGKLVESIISKLKTQAMSTTENDDVRQAKEADVNNKKKEARMKTAGNETELKSSRNHDRHDHRGRHRHRRHHPSQHSERQKQSTTIVATTTTLTPPAQQNQRCDSGRRREDRRERDEGSRPSSIAAAAAVGAGAGADADACAGAMLPDMDEVCREIFLNLLRDFQWLEGERNANKNAEDRDDDDDGDDNDEERQSTSSSDDHEMSTMSVQTTGRGRRRHQKRKNPQTPRSMPSIRPVSEPTVGRASKKRSTSPELPSKASPDGMRVSDVSSNEFRDQLMLNDSELRQFAADVAEELYVAMRGPMKEAINEQKRSANDSSESSVDVIREADAEIRHQV